MTSRIKKRSIDDIVFIAAPQIPHILVFSSASQLLHHFSMRSASSKRIPFSNRWHGTWSINMTNCQAAQLSHPFGKRKWHFAKKDWPFLHRIFGCLRRYFWKNSVWYGTLCDLDIHPGILTWNLRIHPWKRKNIFLTIIFKFYVNLRGCMFRFFTNLYFRIQRTSTIMTVLHGSNSASELFHPKLFGAEFEPCWRTVFCALKQRPFLLAVLSFRNNLCLDTTKKTERFLVTVCQLLHMQHISMSWETRVYLVEKVFFLSTLELRF